jgi:hypothetical protein
MSKYLLIIFLLFIFNTSSSKADKMPSIEKYFLDKDTKDYNATIYSLVRCSGLSRFSTLIAFEKDPKLSEKFKNMSADFALAAAKYDSLNSSRTFEQSSKNTMNSVDEIYKIYLEDGKKNWSKTGSYYLGSYIEEDANFCAGFYKQIPKLLK